MIRSVVVEQIDTSMCSPIPAFRTYPDIVYPLLSSHIAQDDLKFHDVLGFTRVTYKTGSGLGDWIYWHLIHTARNYRQYSAIADLHNLHFTFILALGFRQSQMN
jgi:hypothetical protein